MFILKHTAARRVWGHARLLLRQFLGSELFHSVSQECYRQDACKKWCSLSMSTHGIATVESTQITLGKTEASIVLPDSSGMCLHLAKCI